MKSTACSMRAIVIGGLVAGTVDIGAAALINHASPVLIAHFIATGLLGKAALSAGASAAYLGLVLQWAMSIVIAAIYWSVTARMPRLRERWWLGGLLAGVIIYLVMNFVVLPLSAAPVTLHQLVAHLTVAKVVDNLVAMLVFGLIIAFCARYLGSRAGSYPGERGAGSAVIPVALLTAAASLLLVSHPSSAQVGRPQAAQSPDPVTLIASARNAIDAAKSGWLPAMERGDATAVAGAYADDGVLITSKGAAIRGRASIAALYRGELTQMGRVVDGGLVQEGVTVSGGMIYEWGHGWLAFQKDGKRRVSSGPYFTVWRKAPDGAWSILRNLVL
ncbi:MAG: YybH family protein [Steroidobacteraceae bacterium]